MNQPISGPTRVAIYTRISTDEEHQPYSLEAQSERLASYVSSQDGWEVVRRFSDQMSGSTLERPQLQCALDESRLGRFDLLLVYRVDRLSRSVRGLAQILEELDQAKVVFRSATEPFDTGSPAGRMMVQMLGVFAEFERATIIDRVVAGMERKAARGGWLGGTIPFGYRRNAETDTLEPHDTEAPLVPVIFDLYVNKGLGCRAIANWLNEGGSRTRGGRLWSHMSTMTVLRNEAYLGRVNFRDKVYAATHPPLIEEPTLLAAQVLLADRGANYSHRRSNGSDYLLGGLPTCTPCGSKFIGTAARGHRYRYRYYTCHRRNRYGTKGCPSERLPADELDQAVLNVIRDVLTDSDLLDEALDQARRRIPAATSQLKEQQVAAEAEIRKTEEAIERYLLAFEAGTMKAPDCATRLEALKHRLEELQQHSAELTLSGAAYLGQTTGPCVSADQILFQAFETTPVIRLKPLIQALVSQVHVDSRDGVRLKLRIGNRRGDPARAA
jgi:site-specific DNA recombinase